MPARVPFVLQGADNKSWAYSHAPHCERCTLVTDPTCVDSAFKLVRRDADMSYTYDHALIVSSAFVEAVQSEAGAAFVDLPNAPGYYRMEVEPIVTFDAERRRVQFGERCSQCGRHERVIGARPAYLIDMSTVRRGFSRTDLGFGDSLNYGPNQPVHLSPLVIVDHDLGQRLREAGLRQVRLEPVAA